MGGHKNDPAEADFNADTTENYNRVAYPGSVHKSSGDPKFTAKQRALYEVLDCGGISGNGVWENFVSKGWFACQVPSSEYFQSGHHPQVPRSFVRDLATHAP